MMRVAGNRASSATAVLWLAVCLGDAGARAGELTASQQTKAYEQCFSPCHAGMDKSAFGQAFRDKPFVYQAYCSCFCTRIALRLTTEQLAVMGKDAVNKGDMFFSQETQAFARRAAEQCFEPLMSK